MCLTVEEYNELMLELETSVNYLKSLESKVESNDATRKLTNAIKALEELPLV